MGEAIVITSGKGGVGKTTTTANLGISLALMGKKVCLVDTDIGLRNLDVVMGLENRILYDLIDVVEGTCRLKQALVRDKRFDALYMLPAAQTKDKNAIKPDQVKLIVEELKKDFDYVLIDCPAGIEQGFKNAIAGADHAIIVTTPEVAAVRDADRIIGLLEAEKHIDEPKLIVNRIKPHMAKKGEMLTVEELVQILAIDLIGVVMDDEEVIHSANRGEPTALNPDTLSGVAYRNIARRILGETVPLMNLEQKTGIMNKFRKLLGIR